MILNDSPHQNGWGFNHQNPFTRNWLVVKKQSWKIWVRQWEGWHPIYEMENKTCSKPPTSIRYCIGLGEQEIMTIRYHSTWASSTDMKTSGEATNYPIPWSSQQDVFIFGMSQVTLHPCSSHQNSWQMDVHHPKHYIHRLYSYWSIAILVSTVGCWANVATDRGEGSFIGIMPNMWSCTGRPAIGIYHNFPISWNTIVCWLVFLYCWYGLVHKPG